MEFEIHEMFVKMKILSVLSIITICGFSVYGQKTSKNNFTGSWQTAGVTGPWSNGVVPAITSIGDAPNIMNWFIDGYVTSRTVGSPAAHTFAGNRDANTFTVRDTLVIYGNVTFQNKSMNFVIPTGGIVIIFGNMTFANQLDIGNGGILVVTGQVQFTGGAGQTNFVNSAGGKFFPMGGITGTHIDADATAQATASGPLANSGLTNIINFVNGTATSLPVELVSFKVANENNVLNLLWTTASQLNFSHFEVEHSINGTWWTVLSSINGEGTTNELLSYKYSHIFPAIGKNYYRLKMVDIDESFEYSSILLVEALGEVEFTVSPNPCDGNIFFYHLNQDFSIGDQVTIYDAAGIKIYSLSIESSFNEVTLPFTLKKGIYLVRYSGSQFSKVVRLSVN